MKKILSIVCILALFAAFAVLPASAVEAAQTIVDVSTGDAVTYQLSLSNVDEPVVGCDFSVYYDSSLLQVESVADFTNSTNEEDWRAIINYNLDGEVIGNWSILKGVNFSSGGNIVTVNFKAKATGSCHLSYYVRYMYPDSLEEFTKYTFTCNLSKNGEPVLENAQPELNVSPEGDQGQFINSLDGDSANAGQDINLNTPQSAGAEPNENNNGGNNNNANGADTNKNDTDSAKTPTAAAKLETVISTDADGNQIISVVEATPSNAQGGSSPALWIVIGVIVLAAAGLCVFFVVKKKKGSATAAPAAPSEAPDTDKQVTDKEDK